jgi:ABC-type Fe3+ transport system permease subunit
MPSFRWFRMTARGLVSLIQGLPVVALLVAVACDRGPAGGPRLSLHVFPVVLWIFDDFAWTCARNSVFFGLLVSLLALVVGVGLSWVIARRRFWGRPILRAAVTALPAVPPAFAALGILGLLGEPQAWPWPLKSAIAGEAGASLESWRGVPLWIVWLWTTLPGAAVLVALAATGAVERLERTWEDAARLTGASPGRIWWTLSWPIVRPAAFRAAALVFVFALFEPGAPLILGLRRTLAFQIVDLAAGRDPFPRVAVWALMAGLLGLAGWAILRWRAGPSILARPEPGVALPRHLRHPRRASALRASVSTVVLATWALAGWLPVTGLVRMLAPPEWSEGASTDGTFGALFDVARRIGQPPVPQLAANSLVFGIEVACGIMVLAWIVQPAAGIRAAPRGRWRWLRPITQPPQLLLGVGILAVPWLASLVARFLMGAGRPSPARVLDAFAAALDPLRNSWLAMGFAVALALAPRLFASWRNVPGLAPSVSGPGSAGESALLFGASNAKARWLSAPRRYRRGLGRFVLAWALAATNLTPALLFAPWSDERTVVPGVVILAGGVGEAAAQAAALALLAVAVNMTALVTARLTSAVPRAVDFE